jgi:hypothetical protein
LSASSSMSKNPLTDNCVHASALLMPLGQGVRFRYVQRARIWNCVCGRGLIQELLSGVVRREREKGERREKMNSRRKTETHGVVSDLIDVKPDKAPRPRGTWRRSLDESWRLVIESMESSSDLSWRWRKKVVTVDRGMTLDEPQRKGGDKNGPLQV